MDNFQFDEVQQANSFGANRSEKMSALTSFFIKIGLAKDQKQANNLMLMISIICLVLMAYFLISTYFPNLFKFSKPKTNTTPASLQQRLDALKNGAVPTASQ